MPLSNGRAKTTGQSWFSSLVAAAADAVGASRLETLEIMTDVEQVSLLFSSMDDARQGRVVNISEAFGDL